MSGNSNTAARRAAKAGGARRRPRRDERVERALMSGAGAVKLHAALASPSVLRRQSEALERIGALHGLIGSRVVENLSTPAMSLTAADLAARVDRTPETVRRWLRSGQLPSNLMAGSPARGSSPPVLLVPTRRGETRSTLDAYVGQWVALRGEEVLAAGETPAAVVMQLRDLGTKAESMFRVPSTEREVGGVAPA